MGKVVVGHRIVIHSNCCDQLAHCFLAEIAMHKCACLKQANAEGDEFLDFVHQHREIVLGEVGEGDIECGDMRQGSDQLEGGGAGVHDCLGLAEEEFVVGQVGSGFALHLLAGGRGYVQGCAFMLALGLSFGEVLFFADESGVPVLAVSLVRFHGLPLYLKYYKLLLLFNREYKRNHFFHPHCQSQTINKTGSPDNHHFAEEIGSEFGLS